jgi:uncharacterized phage-like protein YoqJ
MSIIAATGHRSKFCPCKYKDEHPWLDNLKLDLKQRLLAVKPDHVIVGGAIGWDTWVAEVALECKLPIHLYIPFEGQGKKWFAASKRKYDEIRKQAAKEIILSPEYNSEVFHVRDRAMVDNCDIVFSLLNPVVKSGGTHYTVGYAKENKKPVINFWRSETE